MDFMDYPTFEVVEGRGILPNIHLPSNYEEFVPGFYQQGRKQDVEDFVSNLESLLEQSNKPTKFRLVWDDDKGLTSINIGSSSGLDLDDTHNFGWPSFQEHNLGGYLSFYAGIVAMKYVSELFKSK